MNLIDACEDCRLCEVCGTHAAPEDQWPCLYCQTMLCASCLCPNDHHTEACS